MNSNKQSKKWWVLIGVSLANFLGCVDFTIVNTALPSISHALHANINSLQWIINIFLLALCALMVISGRLADIYGRRKLLYIGMIGFGLASLGAGLSPTISVLIIFRLLQGIFTAILYTVPGAIISNAFPESQRGKAMGILFAISGIGLAIGPILGGVLIGLLNWHWIFLVNVPVIILSFLICIFSVNESRNTEHGSDIDWLGLCLLIVGLSTFILGIVQSSIWSLAATITLLAIAVVSFIGLYFAEKRSHSPIIKFDLFANRMFISGVVATFALGFFYCLAFFLMPLYLHTIQGYVDLKLGLMLLPTTAIMILLSPLIGRMTDQHGPKLLFIIGLASFIISAVMQYYFGLTTGIIYTTIAFAAMGVGWAALLGPSAVAILSSVPESVGAVAMGSAWTMHNFGGVLGLAIGTVVFNQLTHHYALAHTQAQAFLGGYHGSMVLLGISMIIALLFVTFVMPNKKSKLHVDMDSIGQESHKEI